MKESLSVIDLFAGAGGLSLGAYRAGFKVIGAVELDDYAMDTHIRNFPKTKSFKVDLTSILPKKLLRQTGKEEGELTGIIGGPPCQGFSCMGYGNEHDERNNLFICFFDFIATFKPAFFVVENVLGILNEKYDNIRKKAFAKVNKKYEIIPPLKIRANEYGAATTRTRVFFIGYDKKHIKDLQVNDFEKVKIPENEQISVKIALAGLPENISQMSNGLGKISKMDISTFEKHKKDFYKRIFNMIPADVGNREYIERYEKNNIVSGCLPTKHGKEVKKRYAALTYGQQDEISKSVRLDPNGFCPTLRAGTGPERGSYQAVRPIHYKLPRVITPREAARLQGFPDWFDFQPTIWHSFRQIGNSVSPIVAEKVLSVIYHKFT
jgi:DNA (cytosine-5)-methyltransferase 1